MALLILYSFRVAEVVTARYKEQEQANNYDSACLKPLNSPCVIYKPYVPTLPISKRPSSISSESYSGRVYEREEILGLIKYWADYYGVDYERSLRIASCESGLRATAKNPHSTAGGVYQYLESTFANTPEGKQGISRFDAYYNIKAANRHMSVHGFGAWVCK